jgi:hypothetical protein
MPPPRYSKRFDGGPAVRYGAPLRLRSLRRLAVHQVACTSTESVQGHSQEDDEQC